MPSGVIRRLITDRGYGFIESDDGEDLFFHCSELQTVAFDALRKSQRDEFEVSQGSKGLKAIKVKLIEQ